MVLEMPTLLFQGKKVEKCKVTQEKISKIYSKQQDSSHLTGDQVLERRKVKKKLNKRWQLHN